MKTKGLILLIFLAISINYASARIKTTDFDWKAKTGDSITYLVVKYFNDTDLDGDGNKYTSTMEMEDNDGIMQQVTLKNGSSFKIEITSSMNMLQSK